MRDDQQPQLVALLQSAHLQTIFSLSEDHQPNVDPSKRDASLVLQNGLVGTQDSDRLSTYMHTSSYQPSQVLSHLDLPKTNPSAVSSSPRTKKHHGNINSSATFTSSVNSTFLLKPIQNQREHKAHKPLFKIVLPRVIAKQ